MKKLLISMCCLSALWCCEDDDTGKACKGAGSDAAKVAITDENVSRVNVSITQDPVCETFRCIEGQGLPPYCSRNCAVNSPPSTTEACVDDSNCKPPLHCVNGTCNGDNCRPGFVCDVVAPVGPFAKQPFCIHRADCASDFDCGSIGDVSCVSMGCYVSCDIASPTCTDPHLICEPQSKMNCTCNNDAKTCPDTNLVCQPSTASQPLPAGQVTSRNICMPKG